jgi:2-haloacid dehalogenase
MMKDVKACSNNGANSPQERANAADTKGSPAWQAAVFDLGKVLLDWDPRYYYARHFPGDAAAMEDFLAEAVPMKWVVEMDAGKPTALAVPEQQARHPEHAALIGQWLAGWPHMLRGEIPGTAAIIRELKARGTRLYALTNFSVETFPIALAACPTLQLFEHIVVSGHLGIVKPDPRIYEHTIRRCGLDPARTLFIDDSLANVHGARDAGLHGLHFTSPERLRAEIRALGLLA